MGRNGKQRDAISGKNDEMRLQNGAAENSVLHLLKKQIYLTSAAWCLIAETKNLVLH